MAKYKTLIVGKDDVIIDDIFNQLHSYFDPVTSSNRTEDLLRHLDFYNPEIFMICTTDEEKNELNNYIGLKRQLKKMGIPVVIISSLAGCEQLEKAAPDMADLYLYRPITAEVIKEKILDLIDQLEEEKKSKIEASAPKVEEVKPAEKKHVLIIDDDPLMLKLIKEYLGDKYEVGTAISGKIGLKFLEKKHTDLILLDYEMPDMKGPEVLTKIRENEALAEVPTIFLTGVTDKSKIVEALVLKPQGYVVKPIERDKLMETVEKFIG